MKKTYILNSKLIMQLDIYLSTYTVFILLLMFSDQISANELSKSIFNAPTLDKIGYKETKTFKYNGDRCDRYEGNLPANKHYQGIKSLNPIKGEPHTYYRFTKIKEEFESETMAEKRLKQLTRPYKFKTDSWYSKSCSLKKGFRHGSVVYFVATDAGMFSGKISEMIIKLEEVTKSN